MQAKLLGEFFMCKASDTCNDHHNGIFLPKGAVHQLRLPTYEQVLLDNNLFLDQVVTIPVNLEYVMWFTVINPNMTLDTNPILLNKHLLCKPWFQ